MTIGEALSAGAAILSRAGVAEPVRESRSLLAFAITRDAVFITAHPEYVLDPAETDRFERVVSRRAEREPFQYIVGIQEFFGLEFKVEPGVLIPRPETEVLVEEAIRLVNGDQLKTMCEIGVGTGCISVSILKNCPDLISIATDISDQAIRSAGANAVMHGVADRLTLVRAGLFSGVGDDAFDLIVSNPPYVPEADLAGLQPEVRDFEPHTALTGGQDGLSVIRSIIELGPKYLTTRGILLVEIGWGQSSAVETMFDRNSWTAVDFLPDLQGIPRVVKARRRPI